jgi:predicted CoA-binding protein
LEPKTHYLCWTGLQDWNIQWPRHCPSFHTLRAPWHLPRGAFFLLLRCCREKGMNEYSNDFLKSILNKVKTVAVVGISSNPVRPSYFVARYLSLKGYTVIPVNPGLEGQVLFGEKVKASLSDIDVPVDMIDIFRRSDAAPAIVDEALEAFPSLKVIWMQIGVEHAEAAQKAQARGVDVVQNKCPKIEYQRLFGELRFGGFNTGIISSKL